MPELFDVLDDGISIEVSGDAALIRSAPAVAFIGIDTGWDYSCIRLSKKDAAELGRYLIQLAEGGE